MKVDTQNIGPCKVKVIVKAEADETRKDYEAVMRIFMEKGRVPGFRPGKVPREIIKREFHKEIMEETHSRLLRALHKKAIDEAQIKMVTLTDIADVIFSPETGITFTMTVDVEPSFELPKYKKIPVVFEEPAVDEAQVDGQIEALRKAFAKYEDAAADHMIAADDFACIDFAGFADGQPIHVLEDAAKPISEGTDFWVQVDGKRFIPEVIDALKGLRPGESTEVKFTFGSDHPVEVLRGKKAVYNVTVKAARKCTPVQDAELLEKTKQESMEKLREETRTRLQASADMAEKSRREQAIIEALLKNADFELPESQVAEEFNVALERMKNEAQYRGLTREHLEQHRDAIIENSSNSAKYNLRLRYILAAIADKEGITVEDGEVDAKIAALAEEYRSTPANIRAQIEKNERMPLIRMQIRNEKTIKMLLDDAKK